MVSGGEHWDQEYTITATERDTEDGRGEASDEEETEIGRGGGMATIEDGGNCPRTPPIYDSKTNGSGQRLQPPSTRRGASFHLRGRSVFAGAARLRGVTIDD
ncbi:hypothetical protein PSTG_17284 [Puccinia striiformis f. sp. tritici PST-78]|uniref:Uncharacterized protein n=1 Tax=Puccinia striiformis f. sp. tritici PST-78 TaxID=1165861 RepID=A0A0L0UQ96_9BASI|nr:hypothetical protein PSTG_17284 [Puccinia striiformis f. sp. tritici PST-78]